jgi:hypothetical protein
MIEVKLIRDCGNLLCRNMVDEGTFCLVKIGRGIALILCLPCYNEMQREIKK